MAETWVSMPELESVVGSDWARTLSVARGGTPVYVPKQAEANHMLAAIVGLPAMRALCAEYGGMYITVPNGRKDEPYKPVILTRLEEGQSHTAIALAVGVTERYVRKLAQTMNHKQLTLPLGKR